MGQCEDDLHLSDLAERVERAVLPVPPGAWVQRAPERPAGTDDLLAMAGAPTLEDAFEVLREAAGRGGVVDSAGPRGQGEPRGPDNLGAVSRRTRGPCQ